MVPKCPDAWDPRRGPSSAFCHLWLLALWTSDLKVEPYGSFLIRLLSVASFFLFLQAFTGDCCWFISCCFAVLLFAFVSFVSLSLLSFEIWQFLYATHHLEHSRCVGKRCTHAVDQPINSFSEFRQTIGKLDMCLYYMEKNEAGPVHFLLAA